MTEPLAEVLSRALHFHLRLVPDRFHGQVMTRGWRLLVQGQPFAQRMADLAGQRVAVGVTDTGNEWIFQVEPPELVLLDGGAEWDVRVRANAEDLLRLALHMEDADTLFFHRRLEMEGDTAVGVYLKNFLDSLEVDWAAYGDAVANRVLLPLQSPIRRFFMTANLPRQVSELRMWLGRHWLDEGGPSG